MALNTGFTERGEVIGVWADLYMAAKDTLRLVDGPLHDHPDLQERDEIAWLRQAVAAVEARKDTSTP